MIKACLLLGGATFMAGAALFRHGFNPAAIFRYDNPALFAMPLAFLTIFIVSKLNNTRWAKAERASFEAQFIRSETGIGAAGAHAR